MIGRELLDLEEVHFSTLVKQVLDQKFTGEKANVSEQGARRAVLAESI